MADSSLRILLVEDQADLRRAITAMLKDIGIQMVHFVSNGAEAVEALQNNPVDFILCEWDTPKMSGMELLKTIRNNSITQNIPFLMLSNKGQIDDDEFALTADYNIDAHIVKPISQQRLEILVTDILKKRESLRKSSVHLSRAAAYVDVGAMEEAEAEMSSAHEKPPESPHFWVESAKLFEELGDTDKAKDCYTQATEINNEYAKAYEGLADILEKEGKTDEAFEMLQRSVSISPRNSQGQMKLAKALLDIGDETGAREALYQGIGNEGNEASRKAEAAEFFMELGRADLAETEYAFALQADPSNVHYYNRMGLAFRRQKKIDEAIANYRKALKLAKNDPILYYNLAIAQMEAGNKENAISALRRSLTLNPNFSQAETVLKKLQSSAGFTKVKEKS